MKVNMDQMMVDFDGDPIKDEKDQPWQLKKLLVSSLCAQLEIDKNVSADAAVKRWKFANRLHDGGEQELTPEEASELRDRLPRCYAVILSGQACEMLKG